LKVGRKKEVRKVLRAPLGRMTPAKIGRGPGGRVGRRIGAQKENWLRRDAVSEEDVEKSPYYVTVDRGGGVGGGGGGVGWVWGWGGGFWDTLQLLRLNLEYVLAPSAWSSVRGSFRCFPHEKQREGDHLK